MKSLILVLILNIISLKAFGGTKVYCSHAEICKMVSHIVADADILTQTLVSISGDPHEFEPSTNEIKNLISAPILITGPNELNPWIKKINYQRSKSQSSKTISLTLSAKDLLLYPQAGAEALSHFWLYPKIYCSLIAQLVLEMKKQNFKITPQTCEPRAVETELQNALNKIDRPIVLTHDALLPLLLSLKITPSASIIAIKGSGHHEEVSAKAVKKMYDALKTPEIIWIKETGINVPTNISNKIRPNDKTIELNTAETKGNDPFSVLHELTQKLTKMSEK